MASKKLQVAIGQNKVVVKNMITGEIKLRINNEEHTLGANEQLDITALVPGSEVARIPGLADLIKQGRLMLL